MKQQNPTEPPELPHLMLFLNLIWILMIIALILGIRMAKVEFEKTDLRLTDYFLTSQFAHYRNGDEKDLQITKGEYLLAQSPPYSIKGEVRGTYINKDLIDCLIHYESKGDKWAVGKAGEIGCMQFLPETFNHFCVGIYGYRDDIWNCGIQKDCASELIEDGYLSFWTTKNFCI